MDSTKDVDIEENSHSINVNELPIEILIEIFDHLELSDRKDARLVCGKWLDLMNAERFSRKEKLICRDFHDLNVVFGIVKNSQRETLNLEFQCFNFNHFSPTSRTFWKDRGQKIRSLQLIYCILTDEMLRQVVEFCVNLECLSIEYFQNEVYETLDSFFSPACCLDELVDLQIRRPSLTSLSLYTKKGISENFFYALFNIYPSIKHLSFYRPHRSLVSNLVDNCWNAGFIQSTDKPTFINILRKLENSQESLESLKFTNNKWNYNDWWMSDGIFPSALIPLHFPNLRNIDIYIDIGENNNDRYINFFSHHKHLQSVNCELFASLSTPKSKFNEFVGQLVNCLFNCCLDLQTLKIISSSKVLELHDFSAVELAKCRLKSYAGDRIDIITDDLNNRELLSEKFRFLTHLELFVIDDKGLQSIWQHHHCLMSLILRCRNCTDFGFTGFRLGDENANQPTGYSIQTLSKLKYLDLTLVDEDPSNCSGITEKSFAEFTFPNLFGVKLEFGNRVLGWRDIIKNLSSYCSPKLEGLKCNFWWGIAAQENEYIEWLDLCRKLKNLRILEIYPSDINAWNDVSLRDIFKCCPTLRFLCLLTYHTGEFNSSRFYYYDHRKFSSEMLADYEYRVFSRRIDTFLVDWLMPSF